jgi:hypothetical protein
LDTKGRNEALSGVDYRRTASAWGSAGSFYDEFSEDLGDAILHCVRRVGPGPGEKALDREANAFRDDFLAFHDRFSDQFGISMPRDYLVTVGVRR